MHSWTERQTDGVQ